MAEINPVGSVIRKKRKELGMSQDKLAKSVGYVGKAFISDIERGKAPLPEKKIPKFSKILGIDEADLRRPRQTSVPLMPGPRGEELSGLNPGEIVRVYREARGMSQEDLSLKIDAAHSSQIKDIEKRLDEEFPTYLAVKIAHCLGIPEELFFDYVFDYEIKKTYSPEYIEKQKERFKDHENLMDSFLSSRRSRLKSERALFKSHETNISLLSNKIRKLIYLCQGEVRVIKDLEKTLQELISKAEDAIRREDYDYAQATDELEENKDTSSL
ncbi:MAG TPA: helix-turn-helix transcriptional regulator [archaeon]|nr:helix-turn-helix transcriptional regulator [archaeon]